MRTKTCTACNIAKPLTDFHKSKKEVMGVVSKCKPCTSLRLKESYKANIEERRKRNRYSHYRVQYGLTPEQVDVLRMVQNFKCAICGRKESELGHVFRVDHDHDTGKVRGLLCHNCNCGIGHLRDSIPLIESALAYLRKHQ